VADVYVLCFPAYLFSLLLSFALSLFVCPVVYWPVVIAGYMSDGQYGARLDLLEPWRQLTERPGHPTSGPLGDGV
jgi:hypothetical protein